MSSMKRARIEEHLEKSRFRKQITDYFCLILTRAVRQNLSLSTDLLQPHFCSSFLKQIKLIRFYFAKYLSPSARPGHFDSSRNHRIPQPKISPQVALRKITPTPGNLSNLRDFSGDHPDPGS